VIGLPSLRALDGAPGLRIWRAAEATDMRRGFYRLAERTQAAIGEDPLSGQLFPFRSRNCNRLKILTWDRDVTCCGTNDSKLMCSSSRDRARQQLDRAAGKRVGDVA
jgi:transposase